MSDTPRASIVVPAHEEGDRIRLCLDRIAESVTVDYEVIVVCDSDADSTMPVLQEVAEQDDRVVPLLNGHGAGPANAIRAGVNIARAEVIVVTMADGSDDPEQIDDLVRLVERGVVVAAASRYMPGGQQVDAPLLKALLSRIAGRLLATFARVGTRDATNSFKAYSAKFVREVGIDARHGFEMGLELVAKARRRRLPVAEVPTIWIERQAGESNFRLIEWIPKYMRWFRFAFGPRLELAALRRKSERLRGDA